MGRFHLKILIGLLAFFGLVTLGVYLYEPFMLRWYEWQLGSNDPADKVAAVDGFIGMGELGKQRFREVFADGPEIAELLCKVWKNPDNPIEITTVYNMFPGIFYEYEDDLEIEINQPSLFKFAYCKTDAEDEACHLLHLATMLNKTRTINLLKEINADFNLELKMSYINHNEKSPILGVSYGLLPIDIAIIKKDYGLIQLFIGYGADINCISSQNSLPIIHPLYSDDLGMVKFLVNNGASLNFVTQDYCAPLNVAVECERTEIVEFFLKNGARPDGCKSASDLKPIHQACRSGNKRIVELLLAHGAKINATESKGFKPIHCAAASNNNDLILFLVNKGANINSITKKGFTAAITTLNGYPEGGISFCLIDMEYQKTNFKDRETLKLLKKLGADLGMADNAGKSPIHYAAGQHNPHALRYLIKETGHVNVVDNKGNTPLYYALKSFDLNNMKYLLDLGAKVNIINKKGLTPIDTVINKNHFDEKIALLRSHGSRTAAELKAGK